MGAARHVDEDGSTDKGHQTIEGKVNMVEFSPALISIQFKGVQQQLGQGCVQVTQVPPHQTVTEA